MGYVNGDLREREREIKREIERGKWRREDEKIGEKKRGRKEERMRRGSDERQGEDEKERNIIRVCRITSHHVLYSTVLYLPPGEMWPDPGLFVGEIPDPEFLFGDIFEPELLLGEIRDPGLFLGEIPDPFGDVFKGVPK